MLILGLTLLLIPVCPSPGVMAFTVGATTASLWESVSIWVSSFIARHAMIFSLPAFVCSLYAITQWWSRYPALPIFWK